MFVFIGYLLVRKEKKTLGARSVFPTVSLTSFKEYSSEQQNIQTVASGQGEPGCDIPSVTTYSRSASSETQYWSNILLICPFVGDGHLKTCNCLIMRGLLVTQQAAFPLITFH